MRQLGYLFFLWFVWISSLPAQSETNIIGVVRDSLTGQPIADAAVSVLGTPGGAYTNRQGEFSLADLYQGTYQIAISHIGYHSRTVRVSTSRDLPTYLTVPLRPRRYHLPPVIVEEKREEPQAIEISRSELQESQAETLDEVLAHHPEISMSTQSSTGGMQVRIRGSDANQVLVLLDGIPLNDPMTGSVDLSQIPAGLVESVTIHTRGSSAEYGSGAFAGVVNIRTRSRPLERLQIKPTIGTPGRLGLSGDFSGKLSSWTYNLFAEHRDVRNDYAFTYQRPDGTRVHDTRQNTDFRLQSLQAGIIRSTDSGRFNLRTNFLRSQRGIPGRIYQWTPYARANDRRFGAWGSWQQQWDTLSLDVQSSYGQATTRMHNSPPPDAPLRYRTVPAYSTKYEHHSLRNRLQLTHQTTDGLSLEGDLQHQRTGFDQEETASDYARPIHAAEQQYGAGFGGKLQLPLPAMDWQLKIQPMLRYSHIDVRSSSLAFSYPFRSYSVNLSLTWNRRISGAVYANSNRSFRIPTFGDLFYQDFRVSGNPDLRPERGSEHSMGFRLFGGEWFSGSLNGEVFRKTVTDQIIWVTGSFGNFTPTNTDSRITGQSVSFDWELPGERLFGQIFFERLVALDRTPNHALFNKQLPFRPRYRAQLSLGSRLEWLEITYHHRYRGRQFITRANTKALPPYDLGDLIISAEIDPRARSSFHITVGARIDNLWETSYQTMDRMPEPGRTFLISFTLGYTP